ncbi:MAG: zinc-finger domain-containing protein [Defluviicoccus sp.]|nr:zinc-finger domain-containing protein [Defluviicoccus sp.]MDS4072812.1 zinc-finger domain-containing protein [Defluviicoccus sp.]
MRTSIRYHPGPRSVNGASWLSIMDATITPDETIIVDGPVAACDGGGGPLGHPRVYLNLGPAGSVVCPYCSRRFALREGATVPAH